MREEVIKRSYTLQQKLEVLNWINEDAVRNSYAAQSEFGIDSKTIRNWQKEEEILRQTTQSLDSKRLRKLQIREFSYCHAIKEAKYSTSGQDYEETWEIWEKREVEIQELIEAFSKL